MMQNEASTNGSGTKALVLGFIALNILLHQAFIRGIGSPEGASQLVMWVAVIGIVGYPLLHQNLLIGYWLAIVTGLLGLVLLAIISAGILGPMQTGGPMIGLVLGPVAYGAYSIVLMVVAFVARRR